MKKWVIFFVLALLPLQLIAASGECYSIHRSADGTDVVITQGGGDIGGVLDHDENACPSCHLLSTPLLQDELAPFRTAAQGNLAVVSSDELFRSAEVELFYPPPRGSRF